MRQWLTAVVLAGTLLAILDTQPAAAATPLSEFAFQPNPGAELPLAVMLDDEQGRALPLAAFFTGKPVVLVLEYLRCRTFCGLTLQGLIAALHALPLDAGRDFHLVAISIDPRDTPEDAASAKAAYLAAYRHPDAENGVHFLTGPEAAVRRIAEAVGFPYRYEAALDQFIHPAGLVIASPDGRISRYLLGLDRSTAELEAGLAASARGQTFDVLRPILLLCHATGLPTGRYSARIMAAFGVANIVATAFLIAVFVAVLRRRRG
jgi:protein SCO1/2